MVLHDSGQRLVVGVFSEHVHLRSVNVKEGSLAETIYKISEQGRANASELGRSVAQSRRGSDRTTDTLDSCLN